MKAAVFCVLLTGCATTLDPNYALQLEAYRQSVNSQAAVEMARAKADEARYMAMAEIAGRGGPQAQQMAIFALAFSGRGGDGSASTRPVILPNIPETQEDRALKWASVFSGPTTALVGAFFGYRLGVTQSNNAATTTTASYNAFSNIATTGYSTLGANALAGYGAVQNIAGGALGVATTGINTLPQLKPPVPTIPNTITTLNGNGVIGSGVYTGDNSGAASGNTGTIRVLSPDTTRNCTGTTNPAGTTNPTGTASANC